MRADRDAAPPIPLKGALFALKWYQNKFGRQGFLLGLLALLLVAVVALQLFLFSLFREARFFGDMTTEGIYTMTDRMKKELSGVSEEVKVTFCVDPDRALGNEDLRPIYILAKELSNEMPNIKVETLDLRTDSHAADAYKVTAASEIAESDIIVSYGQKHRIASAESFYTVGETSERWSFKGEFQLASMILSVVRVHAPVAYFTVGHGERYYDTENASHADNAALLSFFYTLTDLGMSVKTLDLDAVDAVPEDCVLLLMNGPKSDYTGGTPAELSQTSPLDKIESYLWNGGSFLFLRDPATKESAMPVLSEYLSEWGIAYRDDTVKEPLSGGGEAKRQELSVTYATSDSSSVAYNIYQAIADLVTAPRTLIANVGSLYCPWEGTDERSFLDNVSRKASPLFFSSEKSSRYDENGALLEGGGGFSLGMIGVQATLKSDATYEYAYMLALGSTSFIEEGYYGSTAYANRDVTAAVLRTMTRTDSYAASDLGSADDLNSENYGGKIYESDDFVEMDTYYVVKDGKKLLTQTFNETMQKTGYVLNRTLHPIGEGERVLLTILFLLLPVIIIPAAGIYVMLRRRHL